MPSPSPTLVLIHGLYSSPAEFSLMTRPLRAQGVRFECLEVPGYTRAAPREQRGWRDWVRATAAALDARYPPDEPLVLAGLCVGGVIAAALALEGGRRRIAGIALLAPTFAYDGPSIVGWKRVRRLAYLLRIDRWLTMRESEPYGIKNEKLRGWIRQELEQRSESAVGPASLPLRAVREAERLYAHVGSRIGALDVPLLVVHARDDEIATLASVERVLGRARPGRARLVVLEDSFHMITLDNDRGRVVRTLAGFVGAVSTAPTAAVEPSPRKRSMPAALPAIPLLAS